MSSNFQNTLQLDDSKKNTARRQGLTKNYSHTLLQSVNRSSAAPIEQSHMSKVAPKTKTSGNGPARNLQNREQKDSDKENQYSSSPTSSGKKRKRSVEEDIYRAPDISSDSASDHDVIVRPPDSSEDESPSKVNADMTKTLGKSIANKKDTKLSQSSPKLATRKTSRAPLSDSKKRKSEADPPKNNGPAVDMFGSREHKKKNVRSYTKFHKEPKFPKPGRNAFGKNEPTFKKYDVDDSASETSLVGDEEEPTFKPVILDDSPKKSSPTKAVFVAPGSPNGSSFADSPPPKFNNYLGVDSPKKGKTSRSREPPATQFTPFQRYDDDDDLFERAEELVKGVKVDGMFMATQPADDSMVDAGPRCPMCNEVVDADHLKEFGEMNTRKQERFCRSHQKKSAQAEWKSKGYPDIDWTALDSRIEGHYKFIKKLIGGAPCHFRHILDENVKAGKDRNLLKNTSNLTPGYYGSRGLRLISENIMSKFTPMLKERAPKDKLMAARSPTAFVQSVVVPEVVVLLIREDMKVDSERAREIIEESSDMGELINEEIQEVVTKRVDDSDDEEEEGECDDSDDDDDDDDDELA